MHTNILNSPLCAKCKGRCCRRYPGACVPSDIVRNYPAPTLEESVENALASGHYSIDSWKPGGPPPHRPGGPRSTTHLYYIRPSIKEGFGWRYDPTWGGECNFLNEGGCELEPELRPAVCRLLVPQPDHKCTLPTRYEWDKYVFERIWRRAINLRQFK